MQRPEEPQDVFYAASSVRYLLLLFERDPMANPRNPLTFHFRPYLNNLRFESLPSIRLSGVHTTPPYGDRCLLDLRTNST